jgi:hypothetical protein
MTMAQENSISQDLYDLLTTQNFDPETTDQQGQPSQPGEGAVFSFDYTGGSGKNYGTAVLVVGDGNDLMFFFGDNLGQSMEEPDKSEWFQFIQQLKQFAAQHRYTWSMKDLNKLKHTMAGMAAIKEGLFEGYYGSRKVSYAGEPTQARLMIKHNKTLGENDARFRYVESLFIETADAERFKLPFKNLAGGRAMLEHVRQGGKPYDVRGDHITEMVNEVATLARFNRASNGRVLEGVTQEIVTEAQAYYKTLRESLKQLAGTRGYTRYFESWSPADINSQDGLVEDIKTMFIEQTIDSRIEDALPLLAKIQQQGKQMKEADIFENWINTLSEGTWALPDTPEAQEKLNALMSQELIVGPDATNATELLYDIVGDDVLFDRLQELAERDPRANIWDDTEVQQRFEELGIQTPNTNDENIDIDMNTDGIDPEGDYEQPEPAAPAPQPVAESQMSEVDLLMQDIGSGEADIYDVMAHPKTPVEKFVSRILEKMYEDVTVDNPRLHPDDNFEEILEIMADQIAADYPADVSEADDMSTFESSGCNSTMEGEMCPEHGLAECGMMEAKDDPMNYNAAITGAYYESDELARLKTLAFSK